MLVARLLRIAVGVVLSPCVSSATRAQTAIPYVVRDLFTLPSNLGGYYNPGPLFAHNGIAYFAADSMVNGRELYRTDGTTAGTSIVRDINPGSAGSSPDSFFDFLGILYFVADDGTHGRELWRSDNTVAGTRKLADLTVGPLGSSPSNFAVVGPLLYFNADNNLGDKLFYVFDGTTISIITNGGACCSASGACTVLTSGDCGVQSGRWGGFRSVCAPNPCTQPIVVSCCMPDKACIYAAAADCLTLGGTPNAPNAACSSTCPDPAQFMCCLPLAQCMVLSSHDCGVANGAILSLSAGCSPTVCDCSPTPCAPALQACCIPSGQCFMVALASDCNSHSGVLQPAPHSCYANGMNAVYCTQPDVACCMASGACVVSSPSVCRANQGFLHVPGTACAQVLCFTPNTNNPFSSQVHVYSVGARALFLANVGGQGQVWTTDGTLAGTNPAVPLPSMLGGTQTWVPFVARNRLYFLFDDGVHGAEMWETDGTSTGTFMVKDIGPGAAGGFTGPSPGNRQFVDTGAAMYFQGVDSAGVTQLWKTDDTDPGTVMITSAAMGITLPNDLTAFPGGLMFTAQTIADAARRWWFTDGTPAGTHVVGPMNRLVASATLGLPLTNRIVVGNTILYQSNNPFGELWSTDGTDAGTHQIFPLVYDQAHPDPRMWTGLHPTNFVSFNGHVYFSGDHQQQPTMLGNVLWTTDGTADGTTVAVNLGGGTPATWGEMAAGANNDLFFSAQSPTLGWELFKTDGSVPGTAVVKDLNPGVASSNPSKLTFSNGLLMFNATVPGGTQLVCRSDGTSAGTYPLGSLVPGDSSGSQAGALTAFNGQLYYFETTPQTGLELWRTDGTPAGTGLVVEAVPGAGDGANASSKMIVHNGSLYFAGLNGLYRTNGTAGGTQRILATTIGTVVGGFCSSPLGLFFAGPDNSLWITDGSPAGTHRVVPSSVPPYGADTLVAASGLVFFIAQDPQHGRELWRSDGTATGTWMVADLVPGTASSGPSNFSPLGASFFFLDQGALYISDGSTAGTHPFLASGAFTQLPDALVASNGRLFISGWNTSTNRRDLWACDPTTGALTLLTPSFFTYSIQDLVTAGPYLYFARRDANGLRGLYRTDGTAAGTVLVSPPDAWVSGSAPSGYRAIGNDVYFSALRSDVGVELFRMTFPSAGFQLVGDVLPGASGSYPAQITAVGSLVFFAGQTAQHGLQVYVSDTTPAGAHVVKFINAAPPAVTAGSIMAAGGLFYYTQASSDAIMCSDGSPENTYFLADFAGSGGVTVPIKGAALGGRLYFNGNVAGSGFELCVSDGTLAGSHVVADLAPGADGCSPDHITTVGNRVFFSGSNTPDGTNFDGAEPCVSDGTALGTHRAGHISTSTGGASYPTQFTDLNGLAIFVALNGGYGTELYRSDGTATGTYLLKDIMPGESDSNPRGLVAAGNYVFFSADDGVHGRELWRTDGTMTGTVMVRDICFGDVGSNPDWITTAGNNVYFTAYVPETGVELWTSDGTAGGTFMLFEIVPGPSSANIRSLTRAGNRLYFLATVPPQQPSLWSFDWAGGLFGGFTCAADYNRSGSLNTADIFDYLTDWFNGANRADFNGSGALEAQDIFDFLGAWFAGCP